MCKKITLILFYLNILAICPIMSQNVVCSEFQNKKQLPMAQVFRIFQDSEGYMWYGTQGGGLCRDDGYSIKTFRSDFNTPHVLESNWITCITEDNKHRIWFGTRRGLYILDKKDYSISLIKDREIDKWSIDAICASSDGTIWVSTGFLLLRYNLEEEKIATFSIKWKGHDRKISQIYEDNHHNIWIVQWQGGLFKYSQNTNNFISYNWPYRECPTEILQDSQSEKYWISTWGKGIIDFTPQQENIEKRFRIKSMNYVEDSYSQRHIYGMTQDSTQRNIWTITSSDLYCYKEDFDGNLTFIKTTDYLPQGKKLLNQIITDKKGNVWIASDYPSSYILSFLQEQFHRDKVSQISEILGFPTAPETFIYNDGVYWFWQKRNGLFLYDSRKKLITNISHSEGFKNKKKSPLIEDSNHNAGIYTVLNDTEIVLVKQTDGKIETPELITQLPSFERIHRLYATPSDIWIGTSLNFYRYNFETSNLKCICKDIGVINDIAILSDGSIYLATEKQGLYKILNDGKTISFAKNEDFSSVTVASDGAIWGGTHQGNVYYQAPQSNNTTSIGEQCGLNGDDIIAIEADDNDNIWILTNQRVIIYNFTKRSSNVIYNYDPTISMNNFLSLYKDKNGIIHIGGIGGFCSFFNKNFIDTIKTSPVRLTSVNINGKLRLVGKNETQLILKPHEKNIELNFSTLNPLNSDKTRLAFRYKEKRGYWNYLPEGHNNIFLTNLSHNVYNLEVKATNKNGKFSDHITNITINRLPAWHETILAFIIFAIITISLILFAIYIYLKQKKQKIANQQIYNSAIDLQELVSQLSEDVLAPTSSDNLSIKNLLLNMKEILQRQKEQEENTPSQLIDNNDEIYLSASDQKFVQTALNYVENNLDNVNYKVEQLSSDLGMDRTGLYRKLVSIIGKTPTSFIRSIRLKRAARLLEEGFTVAETADYVGFGTASYLSKCFKEEFGTKPSEYIASLKRKNSYNN